MLKIWIVVLLLLVTGCRRQSPTPTVAPTPVQPTATYTVVRPTATPTPVVHIVQPGESLSGIALQYDVPLEALVEANDIDDPNVIRVGQRIVIPGPTAEPTATVPPTITPTPDVPPQLEILDVIGRGAPAAETVIVVNRGRAVSLSQWTIRDGQGNVFVFPDLYLAAGSQVRVHTGVGDDTPEHLYWDRETAVWEESGDTVILADERGVIYASKTLD